MAESELLLLARAIDSKISYIESKLEKPHYIGFNHNDLPVQEAENIVNDLLKDIQSEIDKQKDIHAFLDEEIKYTKEANEECTKFLANNDQQLQELETFVSNSIPGYKKFIPPEESCEYLPIENFRTDPIQLDEEIDPVAPPVPTEIDTEANDCVRDVEPPRSDDNDRHNLDDMLENGIDAVDLNSFEQNSTDAFPSESQMYLVTSPIVETDSVKAVSKKLDFDHLSNEPSHKKPFVCSTEKKSKTPVEIHRQTSTLNLVPEDIENISGIQLVENSTKSRGRPIKPVRRILLEKQLASQSEFATQEGGGAKTESRTANIQQALKDQIPSLLARKVDPVPVFRRDTLGGRNELPVGLRDGFTRDTLGRRDTLGGRRDTLGGRRDTLGGRRETLKRGELPTGPLGAFARDTLGLRRDLPLDGFRRDTLGTGRDTLGGRKELPSGLRDGFERQTLNRNLPSGTQDGRRDAVTGEVINGRRLSHYRAVPPKINPCKDFLASPKQPVLSEMALRIMNKYV